ncbi:MAG: hypothetical protein K2X03_11905 [Bryobacteraceae bacterium]|nr:hypothetical protein [Bryobacteraceae bacterium]
MRITRERIINVLGPSPKPRDVWEKQFDGNDLELARLAQLDWDRVPDGDLWYYFHDLAYVDLQPNLFRHLFPACLKYWHESLMRNESAAQGDADFHHGLMRGKVLEKILSETERKAVYDFFRDGLLDRIESERGFFYHPSGNRMISSGQSSDAWIGRLNSLGIVAPVIQPVWDAWWRLDHPGKAVCAVMYSSGLVYLSNENPIYSAWTPESGGGGPYLTELDSSIFDWAWREDNLAFLRRTLTVDYVIQKLHQAAEALSAEPEGPLARRVSDDAKTRRDLIELRIDDLQENLSRLDFEKDRWE